MSVAVVGTGAVASIGASPQELFDNLCKGVSGQGELRGFPRPRYHAQQLFEIDDRPAPGVDEPGRATHLLLEAIGQAVADAGLPDLTDVPVLVGTGLRELRSVELWWRDGTPMDVDRLDFAAAVTARFGAREVHTFSNACSASLYALALGADLIGLDEADAVVVAGVDVVTESMFGLADRVQAHPPDRVRPFDRGRRGTILGEGAAAVVLRRDEHAYAWLRGVAVGCDAYHQTAPDRAGIARTIRSAQAMAGVDPGEVDLVVLHATGTPLNDLVEAQATVDVLGADAGRPLMTGIKSSTGHTSGAAGLMSVLVAVAAMGTGRVPPIANLDDPIDEVADLRLVRDVSDGNEITVAQVHGFGFGGINAVAILGATP